MMENIKKKNKLCKRRMSLVILLVSLCVLFGVFIFIKQANEVDIKFMYNGTLQDSAQMEELCSSSSWSPKDVGLQILDKDADVSDQVQGTKTQTKMGMDVTYTWKDASFILHVSNDNYTIPSITGPSEIEIEVGSEVAKDFLAYGIEAKDFCGKDITTKIQSDGIIDTAVVGEQNIILSVEDDLLHKSEFNLLVRIVEKSIAQDTIEYHNGIANPLTITPKIINNPEKIDVLVNKFNALPDSWTPNDLVMITSNNNRSMQLRQEAASSFEQMNAAALQDEITIRVISAYRTKEYQQSLFSGYYADDPINAYQYSALPRRSEHETGLAIDVSYDSNLYTDLHTSDLGKWMDGNAHKYGFMLRFLNGKETITGYAFEPWHYRYVGVDLATKIKESGLTMEEYYGSK